MFKEAASAGKRELVVRRDDLSPAAAEAIEDGSDASLFAVTSLNNLQVSGFRGLPSLSPGLGRLSSLLQLSLANNNLQSLPEEVGRLDRLRLLDVSRNSLSSLPVSLYSLPSLHTLLLAHNALRDDSFPPVPEWGARPVLPVLQHLDVSGNRLTALPSFLQHAAELAELKASHNSLSSIEHLTGKMATLKLLELHCNQLTSVPPQLSACPKLKTLLLHENPLLDRRLLKLVIQHGAHKPRAILDYVASRAPQPAQSQKKKGKGKGKGRRESEGEGDKRRGPMVEVVFDDSDGCVEFSEQRPVLHVLRPARGAVMEVLATGAARKVRPYLVCCVVRGVGWGDGDALRDFITLQVSTPPIM